MHLRFCSNENAVDDAFVLERKQVRVCANSPTHTRPGLTTALHCWLPSDDAVWRVMGSVFSSRALQQLLQRKRGTLHGWLVHIRDVAPALLRQVCFFLSHFQEVKSKTLCKITDVTQMYLNSVSMS